MQRLLKEYFEGLLVIVTFVSLALGVAHPRLKSAASFSAGVLVICAILLPIVDIIRDIDKRYLVDDLLSDIDYADATDDAIELAFEEGIAVYIADKYGVNKGDVLVMADGFDIGSMRAERIYITLSSRASFLDYKKIEEEIEKEFTQGGECEVSLKIG